MTETRNLVGKSVGNYIINKIIGSGGIGTVYLAHHKVLKLPAAIKVHDYFSESAIVRNAFLKAANYLSQLHHPNIVQLYDYGFVNEQSYIVLEYIEGVTLSDIIPNHPTPEWTTHMLKLFIQLLSAMRYAHNCVYLDVDGERKRGIVHGDIKPQNIFVRKDDGNLKLTDFMLPDMQRHLSDSDESELNWKGVDELDTQEFGTPEYMPPEQWEGELSVVTDIYSLGASLYQTLTGFTPSMLREGVLPRDVNPHIPLWVEDVIIRATQDDPLDRFQSVAEIEAIFLEMVYRSSSMSEHVKEVVMGNKLEVSIGDLVGQGNNLYIGDFNNVVTTLERAGKTQISDALKMLKEAILASNSIPKKEKQELIQVVNQIGHESANKKSNPALRRILVDGLLATLKAIPDVAVAVAAVATILTK